MKAMVCAMPRRRWTLHGALALCVASTLLLAACAVGPDYRRPPAPGVTGYTTEPLPPQTDAAAIVGGEAQRFVPGLDISAQWWTLFHSHPLNQLVAQALRANPNLEAAAAALRVAQENVAAQRGAYYPSAQANFSSTRQKVADSVSSPLNSGETLLNLHTAQVSVSYAPDVFGLNRRQVESLQAQSEAQRFQLEATHITLSANVVVAVVQEASLRAQIKSTQDIIKIEIEQLELLRHQLALGAVAELAVVAQEAALAQTQAALPQLQKQLAQQESLLAVLTGRFPGEEPAQPFDLSMLDLPQELPVSVPSKLVEQRPDVRAAQAQMHAASAQVGVAVANMLPQFALSANGGNVGTQFATLFASPNVFWNIAAGATQPIFEGGALLHKKRAAQAAYEQAAAQYRGAVLTAFQNVADTLRALQYDATALKAALAAEDAAARSLDIARRQLELGDISYLALLGSEQVYKQAVSNRVQAQASRYADTAALFQALGGGWWNRADADAREFNASTDRGRQ